RAVLRLDRIVVIGEMDIAQRPAASAPQLTLLILVQRISPTDAFIAHPSRRWAKLPVLGCVLFRRTPADSQRHDCDRNRCRPRRVSRPNHPATPTTRD